MLLSALYGGFAMGSGFGYAGAMSDLLSSVIVGWYCILSYWVELGASVEYGTDCNNLISEFRSSSLKSDGSVNRLQITNVSEMFPLQTFKKFRNWTFHNTSLWKHGLFSSYRMGGVLAVSTLMKILRKTAMTRTCCGVSNIRATKVPFFAITCISILST